MKYELKMPATGNSIMTVNKLVVIRGEEAEGLGVTAH